MNTLSQTASLLAHSFSYALLYSLWQGLILFALLYLLLKAFPRMSSRNKYTLSVGSFSAVAIWFGTTWAAQYDKIKGVTVFVSGIDNTGIVPAYSAPVPIHTSEPIHFEIIKDYLLLVEKYVPIILTLYCAGLAFMLLRFIFNLNQLRAFKRKGNVQPDVRWVNFVGNWQQHFGIVRNVQLYISSRVTVPMMLGTIKPVILLPLATVSKLTTAQVEAILLHELAHIKRHDYLLNMLQSLVETVLFFNPFIWLISSIVRREREHCCDDLVVASSSNPLHYASALAVLEELRINSNGLSLAATGNKNQLFNRIKRIMEMKKENIGQSRLSVILVAGIAATLFTSMIVFTTSFAQIAKDGKTPQKKTTTTKTVTVDNNGKKKVVTKTSTTDARAHADENEDVDINITISDDDKKKGTARVIVTAKSDDGEGSGEKKKVRKEVIIHSDGSSRHTEHLEQELAQAKRELDKVDWDKIEAELSSALAEVEQELHEIGKEISIEIRHGLEKGKEEMERAQKEIVRSKKITASASAKAGANANASAGTPEMHSDTNEIETMLDKMEKDGLINRSEKFKIEKENGALFINGEKQSAKVYERYAHYLTAKEVTIKGGKKMLNVNMTN